MSISVRLAGENDVEKLIQVRLDYFKADKMSVSSEQQLTITANIKNYLIGNINENFFAAIAEDGTQIISAAFLAVHEMPANPAFPTGKTGTILNVLTYPDYRRKGYALQTLRLLIDIAGQKNLSCLKLSATESGRPLYEKLGFQNIISKYTEMQLSLDT